VSLPARLLAGLLGLLLAAAAGWRQGVRHTLADWRTTELAAERAAAEIGRENQRLAARAATQYEAQRAAQERTHADTLTRLRLALSGPVHACPAVVLGDVLVPAGAVAGLRDAGADQSAPGGATAGSPGR
jgi:hypothetical protein